MARGTSEGESRLVNISVVFIAVVLLAIVFRELQSFLRPFAIAAILTFLLMPVVRYSRKTKIPFWVWMIGLLIIMAAVVTVVGALIITEAERIESRMPAENSGGFRIVDQLSNMSFYGYSVDIDRIVDPDKIRTLTTDGIRSLAQALVSLFSELFIAIIFLIFLIPAHDTLVNKIRIRLDRSEKTRLNSALLEVEQSVKDYLSTKTLISLGTAVVSAGILFIFDVDFIMILAILFFTLNFIPNIGSFLAVILALVVEVLQNGFSANVIFLLVLLSGVQMLFGNILEPKFAGTKLKLSPLVILISLFIWYWIWGVVGMMLAIPLTSIIKITLRNTVSDKENIWLKLLS